MLSGRVKLVKLCFIIQLAISVVHASVWSNWSDWSECGVHDTARQTRFRKCRDETGEEVNSTKCAGVAKRTRQCKQCSHSLLSVRDLKIISSGVKSKKQTWCVPHGGYIQISFKNFIKVSDIRIKSDGFSTYEIKHSYDGNTWIDFEKEKKWQFVKGDNTIVTSSLVTRFLRVYTNAHVCYKLEVYGCEYNCGGLITHEAPEIRPPRVWQSIEELRCLWRIESKSANKLQLQFPYFKIYCRTSTLDLYDGERPFIPDNDENLLEVFCGNSDRIPAQLLSGGAVWMYYHTNSTDRNVGFHLKMNSFTVRTMNDTSGLVTMPRSGYSNIYRYSWVIRAPRNNDTITMRMHQFQSNNSRKMSGKCVADVVIIHYGDKTSVEKYCDATTAKKEFTSTNGLMKIKFKSRTRNPRWKIVFSYQVYPRRYNVITAAPKPTNTRTHNMNVTTSPGKNDTIFLETQRNDVVPESSGHVPIIVSSVIAVVIVTIFVIALVHYLKRRREIYRKHPYDCSNRPMSHCGDHDATPFINTNLLMWNDPKTSEKSKKSLPFIEVTLCENEPRRLSVIPSEMLKSSSQASIRGTGNEESGALVVSDNFTEECMKLLNNNLTSRDCNDEEAEGKIGSSHTKDVERYGSLPEADRRTSSKAVDDSEESLPEAESPGVECEELLLRETPKQYIVSD